MSKFLDYTGLEHYNDKVLSKISQLGLEKADLVEVNGLLNPYSVHWENSFVMWSSGGFGSTDGNFDAYVIRNIGYKRVTATLGFNNNTFAAIAFYSTEKPTTDGYMRSASVRGYASVTSYTANVPDGCKYIVVVNRYITQNSPSITLTMLPEALTISQKSPLFEIDATSADFVTIESGYINFSTGARTSSGNFKRYIIPAVGIERLFVRVQCADRVPAAIAFYNSDIIGTGSYMASDSVQIINAVSEYDVTVPAGCKQIVVSNRSASLASPTVKLFSPFPAEIVKTLAVDIPSLVGQDFSFVESEENLILEKLRNISRNDLITFAFNTDQHIDIDTNAQNNQAVKRGLQSIGKIGSQFPLNLVVLGGDEAGYNSFDLPKITFDIGQIVSEGDDYKCPVVAMAGNHDAYQNLGVSVSDGKMEYNLKLKRNVARKNLDWAGSASTNCWIDDSVAKVRYVFLDGYSVKNGAILRSYGASADTELVNNINSAFSDEKLRNSDWEVIVFSHNVVASAGGNTADPIGDTFWALIQSYVALGVNLVACVNGHAHMITQGVKDDVLMICVSQAMVVESSSSTAINQSFDGVKYINTYGTAKETSYSVFAYDRTAHKIYDFHYGAGVDRVFNAAKGSRGIELDALSGVVSSSATVEGGTITATNHNAVYSVTLDATGAYSFPYLCPEHTWEITVTLPGGGTSTQNYNATVGAHTLNITV